MGSDISMMQYGPGHPQWDDDVRAAEHARRLLQVADLASAVEAHMEELPPGTLRFAHHLRPALASLRVALTDLQAWRDLHNYRPRRGGASHHALLQDEEAMRKRDAEQAGARQRAETEKHPYFPQAYTILHVDTFDGGRDVRHMTETQAEAESWVRRTYGDRIKQDGADRVLVVHRGRVVTSFNVG